MSRPRILITSPIPASAVERLRSVGDIDVHDGASALSGDALAARIVGASAVVAMLTSRFDAAVFAAAQPSLRIVANVAVGFDNIDLEAAARHAVVVTNTPDVLTDATADLAVGMMLGIMRRIAEGDRLIRRGGWTGWSFDFLVGRDPRGKQLGIVGAGRIGRAVATRARAFGMSVAYALREGRTPPTEPDATWMPLETLLTTSDVISLHVPLTPRTRHLLSVREFGMMKPTAFLINTARGAVVDEGALVDALTRGTIAGAALDVFEREPSVHPGLLALENVLLVPHIGSAGAETRTVMANLAADNVVAVLSGQAPVTPVGR